MCAGSFDSEWWSCVDFQLSCCSSFVCIFPFLAFTPLEKKRREKKQKKKYQINEPKEEKNAMLWRKLRAAYMYCADALWLIRHYYCWLTDWLTFSIYLHIYLFDWCKTDQSKDQPASSELSVSSPWLRWAVCVYMPQLTVSRSDAIPESRQRIVYTHRKCHMKNIFHSRIGYRKTVCATA